MWLGLGAIRRSFLGASFFIWNEDVIKGVEIVKTQRMLAARVCKVAGGFVWVTANVLGHEEGDRSSFSEGPTSLVS